MLGEFKFVNSGAVANLESLTPGKVVCVGRNYAEHAAELNNPVPESPVLFIKPSTALVDLQEPIVLPADEALHYEAELAVLIGTPLTNARESDVVKAIAGYGVALDLTKRALQTELKSKGLPWELAKAFDGACPVSPIVVASEFGASTDIRFGLSIDGAPVQQGDSSQMLFPIVPLICHISRFFTLLPGDLILTGTPKGVGELKAGMSLSLELMGQYHFETRVS